MSVVPAPSAPLRAGSSQSTRRTGHPRSWWDKQLKAGASQFFEDVDLQLWSFSQLISRRVARFALFVSQSGTGCPVPSAPLRASLAFFARAGSNNACTMGCHAERTASHLRGASPALYYLLVLSAISFSAGKTQPRLLSCDSRRDSAALPVRGGRNVVMPEHIRLLITEAHRASVRGSHPFGSAQGRLFERRKGWGNHSWGDVGTERMGRPFPTSRKKREKWGTLSCSDIGAEKMGHPAGDTPG